MNVTLNLGDYKKLSDKCYYNHVIYGSKLVKDVEIAFKYHDYSDLVDILYRKTSCSMDWEWIGSTSDYYIDSGELMFNLFDLWT